MKKAPWEFDEGLTEECLSTVARIIMDVRNETVELHDPDRGDGPWGLGCRVYERTINIISRRSGEYSWLQTHQENLYLLMKINGVPVKFFSGETERPNRRALQQKLPEIQAEQTYLPFENNSRDYFWRFAVETDNSHKVLRIVLAQYNSSGTTPIYMWPVPLDIAVTPISSVADQVQDGVVLNSPSVGPKKLVLPEEINAK